MTLPPDPVSATAMSPLTLDPFANNYLGIPSPSGFGGYQSPASSAFGEGSIVYSDHGDDFALYEGPGSGSNFGGTSPVFKLEPQSFNEPQIKFETHSEEQQHPQQLPQIPHLPSYPPRYPSPAPPPGKGKGRET